MTEMTQAEIDAAFLCVDCGVSTKENHEYYMVVDHVWRQTGIPLGGCGNGMLCIGCLEGRVNRKLTPEDFTNYPINRGFFTPSDRAISRIMGIDEGKSIDYNELLKSSDF